MNRGWRGTVAFVLWAGDDAGRMESKIAARASAANARRRWGAGSMCCGAATAYEPVELYVARESRRAQIPNSALRHHREVGRVSPGR